MGLELVEIVLKVESTFGISLPDAKLSNEMRTVGDLYDCILDILGRENEGIGLTKQAFETLQETLSRLRGIPQEQIRQDTQLDVLVPVFQRRAFWRKLKNTLQLPLPSLDRSTRIIRSIFAIAFVLGGMTTSNIMFGVNLSSRDPIIWACVVFVFFGSVCFWAIVCIILTIPVAMAWPRGIRTVGDLTQTMVSMNYGVLIRRDSHWSRNDVWIALQQIIVSSLGVNITDVTPQSRFIEDLGAG